MEAHISYRARILAAAVVAVVVALPAAAQQDKEKAPRSKPADVTRDRQPDVRTRDRQPEVRTREIFRDTDRTVIRRHAETYRVVVKPLPPGIQKQLARGKPLPPGIVQTRLSPELVRVAPRLETGYRYVIVGDNLVVLDRRNAVVDILANLFR